MTVREWRYAAIDWLRRRDAGQRFGIGALVVISAIAVVVFVAMAPRSTTSTHPLDIPRSPERPQSPPLPFLNQVGEYWFAYPRAWDLTEEGSLSRLQSPSGNVVLSFGVSFTDGLERVTTRLVGSLGGVREAGETIGTSRQRIAGAPAFLKSGMTRDETGRLIRYLAIAIGGGSRTYTIFITVPARTDPEQVLSRVERIVTSFGASNESFV